jgi:hypothetical protein
MRSKFTKHGISEAIFSTPPPPCEVYHCEHKERCASENLACYSFNWYVLTGKAASPTLNRDGGFGKCIPTSHTYDKIFREDDFCYKK